MGVITLVAPGARAANIPMPHSARWLGAAKERSEWAQTTSRAGSFLDRSKGSLWQPWAGLDALCMYLYMHLLKGLGAVASKLV